jgi:hypothetical protein
MIELIMKACTVIFLSKSLNRKALCGKPDETQQPENSGAPVSWFSHGNNQLIRCGIYLSMQAGYF